VSKIFLIAGESSGDHLGALLMGALQVAAPETRFSGVGGADMESAGLRSLFPMADLAVMGLTPVLARLPLLLRRLDETTRAILADPPDCLVLIDAPDFTHRVARRVRRAAPQIPIVDYVCPTVWAWRPGRARTMCDYVDHVLAVLPFEPAALQRLDGPQCDYVGHPLVEHIEALTRAPDETPNDKLLLILPGSRAAQARRMTPVYGAVAARLAREIPGLEIAIPLAPAAEATVRAECAKWEIAPRFLAPHEKHAAFRAARAALVTSGAATLELALAQIPMAIAYRVSPPESLLRPLVAVDCFGLPNLILGRGADGYPVPEFLQSEATPQALGDVLLPLLQDGPERTAQLSALARLRREVLVGGAAPSAKAAEIVLAHARGGKMPRG
jgi:lipid-A-disaccharide synthase